MLIVINSSGLLLMIMIHVEVLVDHQHSQCRCVKSIWPDNVRHKREDEGWNGAWWNILKSLYSVVFRRRFSSVWITAANYSDYKRKVLVGNLQTILDVLLWISPFSMSAINHKRWSYPPLYTRRARRHRRRWRSLFGMADQGWFENGNNFMLENKIFKNILRGILFWTIEAMTTYDSGFHLQAKEGRRLPTAVVWEREEHPKSIYICH